MSWHKSNNSNNPQNAENNSIIHCSVENYKGAITWEVEKEPRNEEDQENDHGNWLPEKTEKDD
jgi:hypothetical protein